MVLICMCMWWCVHEIYQVSYHGHLDVDEYLLSVGVDRECRHNGGLSAYDVARSNEIKQVLMNYARDTTSTCLVH